MFSLSFEKKYPLCLFNKRGRNIIDFLINEFEKKGWHFNKYLDSKEWKIYEWPDILITKKEFDNPDYWGLYEFNEKKEGNILLQYNRIFESSKLFSELNKTNAIKTSNQFFTLISIHEIVHWIMHFIPNCYGEESNITFTNFKYDTLDSKDFHECFAQLITFFIAEQDSKLKKLFNWKITLQNGSYLKFQELLKIGINFKDTISLISACRYLQIQSFNDAVNLYEEIKKRRITHNIEPEEWIIKKLINWEKIN